MKGQVVANFIAKFTMINNNEDALARDNPKLPKWKLYFDKASNLGGFGAGLVLKSPELYKLHCN